jgi:hypothetical protein
MRTLLRVVLALVGLIGTSPVQAAPDKPVEIDGGFLDYLDSPEYWEVIRQRTIELEPPPLAADCPTVTPLRRQGWSPVVYPRWSAERHQAVFGTWIERVVVDRCGEISLRRLQVIARPTGDLLVSALVPGGFLGNLRLEYDTRPMVAKAAMAAADCNDQRSVYVIDTRVVDLPQNGAWHERWTVLACGTPDIIDLYFTVDRNGARASLTPFP